MFDGIHHYKNFLDSFSNVKKQQYNSLKNDVSLKLYQDWFIMHYATWQHASGEFKRDTRLALADVFQDLLCFYFNTFLPSPYISIPECTIQSKPRLQVDIAIKKNNKIVFLIEVKTTLGWDRKSIDSNGDVSQLKVVQRREKIAQAASLDKENVIFILSSFGNVNKFFSEQFWIKENKNDWGVKVPIKKRITDEPFSFIFPLFNQYDPRYIAQSDVKNFNWKNPKHLKHYKDDEIRAIANKNICTPFEYILDLIQRKTIT